MPSNESLERLVRLTRKVRDELRGGGMGVTFRYIFRSTTVLARVCEILAEQVQREAVARQALERRVAALEAQVRGQGARDESRAEASARRRAPA
jgi:hypothetical protein